MRLGALRELAQLYSIQLSYDDAAGKKRTASRAALEAALRARAGDDLDEALRARRDELANRVVEPVIVSWGRRRPLLVIHPKREQATIEYDLKLENGDRYSGRLDAGRAVPHDNGIAQTIELPHDLPFGYHRLTLTIDGTKHETLILKSPRTAPAPREKSWGVFLPLYAARTRNAWGAGDLGSLEDYREWINGLGGGIVATLPMLAAFEDEPSPYSPVSRLYWNELYLDAATLPEFRADDLDAAEAEALKREEVVDYRRVNKLKRRVLERMSERFVPDDGFEEFAQRASDYAEFRSHRERDMRTADGDRPVGTHRYHLYVQYRMEQQMRAVADRARRSGAGLYLDFPLGVNPGGYDVWRFRDQFARGASVGAPPDLFFTKGQNWGFPPLDPDAIRSSGHEYLRAAVRHHVEHAGILRIDHVMGLHRLYWIPSGGDAKDGVYVRYPDEEMFAVFLIEANRTGTAIVGEDLGTVPEYVPQAMKRHGLRQMFVVQYEVHPRSDPPFADPPRTSMASINTHDMPTFAGFWRGKDIDDRLQQGLLDGHGAAEEQRNRESARRGVVRALEARGLLGRLSRDTLDDGTVRAVLEALLADLAASDAEMVLVNLEDLWLEREPQNVPGVPERSWRHKLRLSLDEARDDPSVRRILAVVDHHRRKGNGNSKEADERSNDSTGRTTGAARRAGEAGEAGRESRR